MFRLSIIIPWQDGTAEFEDTLVSVLQNRPERCEIIVPHAHDYQDPYGLADEVRLLYFPDANTVELINSALAWSCGEFIHVLGCGSIVHEGWCDTALAHFADEQVASVSPMIVERGNRESIVAGGVTFTRGGVRYLDAAGKRQGRFSKPHAVLAPPLTAGFYRRAPLMAVGAFDPAVGSHYADVELGLTLEALEQRCVLAEDCQIEASREQNCPSSFRTGREAERLFWRHASRRGLSRSLLAHPFAVAARCWQQLPALGVVGELIGRLVASFDRGDLRRYQERLAELMAAERAEPTAEISAPLTANVRRAA